MTPDRKSTSFGASTYPYPSVKKNKKKKKIEPFIRDSERSSTIFRFFTVRCSSRTKSYTQINLSRKKGRCSIDARARAGPCITYISSIFLPIFYDRSPHLFFLVNARTGSKKIHDTVQISRESSSNALWSTCNAYSSSMYNLYPFNSFFFYRFFFRPHFC